MHTARRITLATLALAVVIPALALAQPATRPVRGPQPRVSPPDVAGGMIGGGRVTVYYSRPHTKDPKSGEARKIWGTLVPYGKVWRMGANEATLLVTQKPLVSGQTEIPAGAYSLYMMPNEDGSAKLIINKQIGQWGTEYDESMDLVRVDMTKSTVDAAVEQFTISFGRDGTLKATWENATYTSPPFTVKK